MMMSFAEHCMIQLVSVKTIGYPEFTIGDLIKMALVSSLVVEKIME